MEYQGANYELWSYRLSKSIDYPSQAIYRIDDPLSDLMNWPIIIRVPDATNSIQFTELFDYLADQVRETERTNFWSSNNAMHWQIKNAKNAYVKALEYNKNHAKALQQLGWLHYKDEDDFRSAIEYLKRASEIGEYQYSPPQYSSI